MINYRKHKNYLGSVFSFGAGTQSTAILLLIKYEPERLLEKIGHLPEYILFADTGAESQESLNNLENCKKLLPIIRVKNWERNAENYKTDVPVYFNGGGMMQRQCTSNWKIKPLNDAMRKLYPNKSVKKPIAKWLGISVDEIHRMKESWVKSIENVYPLIELGLNRQDCYQILKKYKWEQIKSRCYMCPYQGKEWGNNPELDKAIRFEKELQELNHFKEIPFLHPSCEPIDIVAKKLNSQTNLFSFDDECDGICGV